MRDLVAVIEAAYKLDGSIESWLEDLAKTAAATFGSTQGAMAFRYEPRGGDHVELKSLVVHGLPPEFPALFFNQADPASEQTRRALQIFTTCQFDSMHARIGSRMPRVAELLNRFGIEDMACINATDPTARGCAMAVADRTGPYPGRTVHAWRRLAAHIAAGYRLRRKLAAVEPGKLLHARSTEAVLTPDGEVEHATDAAEPLAARKALQDALARMSHAQSRRDNDLRSIELWRALVAGRWSMVEHVDSDGRRYYLAHKNDPELAKSRTLTDREQQVLGYAQLGHSNKLIAYSLGLAVSTVSTLLSKAHAKLGLSPEVLGSRPD